MKQPVIQVDAFTDRPFKGNPAALCLLDAPRDDQWMQQVANEMNLAETAYLLPEADGYRLSWFTPELEVPLCGHATVAAAHMLWEHGHVAPDKTCIFYTRSGPLTAQKRGEWIEVSFPAQPPVEAAPPPGLAAALGAEPRWFGVNQIDYGMVLLESEEAVRGLSPDFATMKTLPQLGYVVTARSDDSPYAFVSRFFAPGGGIDEDPVTGSAHCLLAPFWGARLGRTELLAYQASARGGVIRNRIEGDRVILGGQAVTVMRGELLA